MISKKDYHTRIYNESKTNHERKEQTIVKPI